MPKRELQQGPAAESRRQYKREWYSANKEAQKEYQRAYWERRAAAERSFYEKNGRLPTAEEWKQLNK